MLGIHDDGSLSACASVEEALDKSDPDAAAKGFAGESVSHGLTADVSPDESAAFDPHDGDTAVRNAAAETAASNSVEEENPFQAMLASIVSFFRSLFVPEEA